MQLDFIQAVDRAAGDAFDWHFQRKGLEGITNGLLGTGAGIGGRGDGKVLANARAAAAKIWVTRMGYS